WCVAAFERWEIAGCIIRGALLPTPIEDAAPLAGPGAPGRLACLALLALLRRRNLGPEGMPRGFRRPLAQRLAPALWTLKTPVPPGLRATACRAWRHAGVFWECGGGGKAFPWCAAVDKEAGSKNGPSPWQGGKPREVGMVLSALGAGLVAVGNG